MKNAADKGILCPICDGNLKPCRKVRVADTIEHNYECQNPKCPAREAGKKARVIAVETFRRVYFLPLNATRRKKRKNLPDSRQKPLPLD